MIIMISAVLIISLMIAFDLIFSVIIGGSLWFLLMKGVAKVLNIPLDKTKKFWMGGDIQAQKDAPKNTKLLFRFVEISIFLGLVLWVIYLLIYQNK